MSSENSPNQNVFMGKLMLPNYYGDRRICVVGLGYVGLTLAVAMAEVGFDIVGIEKSPETVAAIRSGRAHFSEYGLDKRLAAQIEAGRLSATTQWPDAGVAEVYIITVGTPVTEDRATNLSAIIGVANALARILKDGDLVILRSTVRIGVSRDIVKPILDATGRRYHLAFCPERTLEGRALQELRTLPQIVGGADQDSAVRAAQLFAFVTPTAIRVSSLETAEMIKLINNTQRDLMFAFANEIAEICDVLGVSATEAIRAGNMGYARASMPMPGPVGGPCLEKDAYILAEAVAVAGGKARLTLMGRAVNEDLTSTAIEQIASFAPDGQWRRIAIFGLAFKGRPETSDLRGTLARKLIAELRTQFPSAELLGYDPAVPLDDIASLGVKAVASAADAARDADCIIFHNNNMAFERLDLAAISTAMTSGGLVYDLWSQFDIDTLKMKNDVTYCAFGSKCLAYGAPQIALHSL